MIFCAKCGIELVAASGACIDPEEILYIHQLPYFGGFHKAEPTQWEANAAHPVTADRFSRRPA